MKDKAKAKFWLTFAIMVLAGLVSYMYLYKNWNQKTDELVSSNKQLEERVDELHGYYEKMPEYKTDIAEKTEYIKTSLDQYPSDTKEEDALYLALRSFDEEIGVAYKAIQVGSREMVTRIPKKTVVEASLEGLEKDLVLRKRTTTYSNITNYTELKRLLSCMNDEQQQLAITSISYSINEKKLLEGTVDCTFYMLEGTGKEYVPKEFEDYPTGVAALFGK